MRKSTLRNTRGAGIVLVLAALAALLSIAVPAGALPPETYYAASVAHRGYVDDGYFGAFPIGFNFNYFGNSYSQFYVSSNGYVGFGPPDSYGTFSNECLPAASVPNCIFAFWDDIVIHANGGVIFYQTIGSAPNRRCVIQFTNMGFWNDPTLLGTYSVILSEGSDDIQVQYRVLVDPRSTRAHGNEATIGLNDATGATAVQYSCNSVSVSGEQALRFTPSGGTYTTNSSALYSGVLLGDAQPPTIPVLITPAEGSTVCTQPQFQWTPAENTTSYTFKISTSSNLSGSTDTDVGLNTTHIPGTPLSAGTTYYWAVFANGSGNTTWSEIHSFTSQVSAAPVASSQSVWTTLGGDLAITLNGSACGATLTSEVTSLPAHGELYQYDGGVRGAQITAVPAAVTDPGNQVIYTVNDGVVGTNRGNFNFQVISGGIHSADAQVTVNVYPAPAVTTSPVTGITTSAATGGGEVTADNGYAVTARGVCWGTSAAPTISGSHTTDGTGTGTFTSAITGLSGSTTYHVRAYAINSQGTGYGSELTFSTPAPLPSLTTATVSAITATTASGGGEVTASGTPVTMRGVCWSTSASPTISDSHTTDGTGTGAFTSALTGLAPNTLYHVRAYATNTAGTAYGDEVTFTSLVALPTLTTTAASAVTSSGAASGGSITAGGGASITARGVCWSTSGAPTTSDSHTTDGTGTGTFTSTLTGLMPNTLYHVRAYATNTAGTAYGADVSFLTLVSAPSVTTFDASAVTSSGAASGGNVTATGGATVTTRGVCWSASAAPTLADNFTSDGAGTGAFVSALTGLAPNVLYHARAYAVNVSGIGYGNEVTFTTLVAPPRVTTVTVSGIGVAGAASGGVVTFGGGDSVTARGVCWSLLAAPTTSDGHTTDGAGTGTFASAVTGLLANVQYHTRAYATNSAGTSYGSEIAFTTLVDLPAVTTSAVYSVTVTAAVGGGTVTYSGGDAITARGACWGTAANPAVSGSHTQNAGTGDGFVSSITGLSANTEYHVRAYATNRAGTSYGADVLFRSAATTAAVTTAQAGSVSGTGAALGGTVSATGGLPVLALGVCWGTAASPTLADRHTSDPPGTGPFTSVLTGLLPATTYHARAYATNALGTVYGNEVVFTTAAGAPEVLTAAITAITGVSATGGGTVTTANGSAVTARGVCWNTTGGPTAAGTHTGDGSGTGDFASVLAGLLPSTTYHVRAFAVNAVGTGYGDEVVFTTALALATVSAPVFSGVTTAGASAIAAVTADGGAAVTSRGICWSVSPHPTTASSHVADGAGLGSFGGAVDGLPPNTTCYVRAYAVNSVGTAYGLEASFTSLASQPTLTTADPTDVTASSAVAGGAVLSDGGTPVIARGVCWGTGAAPTLSGPHSSDGSGVGAFTSSLTGLLPGTAYRVRAYAATHGSTAYGPLRSFTTQAAEPVVTTAPITGVTAVSAAGGATVTSDGGSPVAYRGVCWSVTPGPTWGHNHTADGAGPGSFTSALTGLTPHLRYYVRGYAANAVGVAYGNEVTFTTPALLPVVATQEPASVTAVAATCGGNVTSDGQDAITARGVCWGVFTNPTLEGMHTADGTGTGAFTSNLLQLAPGTGYHVRAYATNSAGTAYGEDVPFTTLGTPPAVTTVQLTSVGERSASCEGDVTSEGTYPVTARGVCWSTTANPTLGDNHVVNGAGAGSFTCDLTGLIPYTTYHVRAYASSAAGTVYGRDLVSRTSREATLCAVATAEVTATGAGTARCTGTVNSDGGAPVTARGVCWSTQPGPTVDGAHAQAGAGSGQFSAPITGLSPNTTYYARAYAINRVGTAYGEAVTFGCWATALLLVGPNPTSGLATVRFALASQGPVQVTVFDAAGRRVRSVSETTHAAGIHSVSWDGLTDAGTRAPNGIYYVRFVTPGLGTTRSLVLLR